MKRPEGIDPALYPFRSHFHRLEDGPALHYLDEGPATAAPVVMVHGNPTWSFYYRNLVLALRDWRRCLVPDHIGMGLSERAAEPGYRYTLERRVADLGAWLDAVVPDQAIDLVVHDWGGAIGMAWAAAHPERIRRIVILNSWAFTIPDDVSLPRALAFARTAFGAWLIQRHNAFSGLATRMATASRLAPAVAAGLVAPYRGAPERRLATLRFVQDIPLSPNDAAWAVLERTESRLVALADKPVLIGWGAKDFVFDDRVLARWREILPDAEIDYLEHAGHYVLEDARAHLVPKIATFLRD